MSDEQLPVDDESQAFLAELWSTPVGRRWVLKAGLGSAAALAAEMLTGPALAQAAKRRKAVAADTSLHFALGPVRGVRGLTLSANGKHLALVAHTKASRAGLKRKGGLWSKIDLTALTHHVPEVPGLPQDRAILLTVHGHRGRRQVVVAHLWHVPPAATLALAQTAHRLTGSLQSVTPFPRRLQKLGIKPSALSSPEEAVQLQRIVDESSTAVSLVMLHPNVATINKTDAAVTTQLLGKTTAVTSLSRKISQMQTAGQDFATQVPATNRDGSPAQIKLGNTTTTFSTIKLSNDAGFRSSLRGGVSAGIHGVRNDGALGAVIDKPLVEDPSASTKTWVQPQGVLPQPTRHTASPVLRSGVQIKVKDESSLFGTYTVVNGGYSGGTVPLKLYNNFVRWIWVYVQYLGKDGENLSLNPNAKWPDTQYAQSLGLLPQVFTVLGVPLWDTNTIEVNLNFPEGAHTARILYCGLGSNVLDGGWRQYFPADAYPDRIAPTEEVIFASMVTGLLTIGLTVFALATDIAVAGAFAVLRSLRSAPIRQASSLVTEFKGLAASTSALTAAEASAASLAAGGATYADIANNGGSTANIWNTLLSLASVIPKVIFSATAGVLEQLAITVAAEESTNRLLDAIPVIGEVLAVVEAIGDAATLAEVCLESSLCPWVIENEVALQYNATVTIKHDPRNGAGFPATATSWRLEPKIDGSAAMAPIVGSTSDPGYNRSRDLVVPAVVPFGGTTIQWSFVMLDGPLDATGQPTGNQVGTGVSVTHSNDDPSNVFSDVEITITELPATITASTVFKRASTTAYRTASPSGYTWSPLPNPTGTVGNLPTPAIQSISGATVATVAGVAGLVWEQNDRYFIRGVPLSEPGSTISMGGTPHEGYTRRPFLLFDAFVSPTDAGNHVLLEPDETTDGYHIRRVTLNPTTGSISWRPGVSFGYFSLPVSAAALHSSGRVVAVHTDSGRLAWLRPVETARPPLAAYTAGPGSQIGLLQSPVSIAVTNPGVVLVLESGAAEVSAFDLNGHPLPYFQASSSTGLLGRPRRRHRALAANDLQYSMPLVSAGTYLDLAVDGAGQIYALYFTGDGSDPQDYQVDVYSQGGTPLDTSSPGVNVARLAVDYWRSIYGANYSALSDLGTGSPHVSNDLRVIEPSLSRFDPTQPSLRSPTRSRKHKHPKRRHRHPSRERQARLNSNG
ncbi:MAG: hypothetical protein JO168_18255 [Solirubrobacterales bacterium]|nr:hypothetical protein [Solirubrobacterales bacterium]